MTIDLLPYIVSVTMLLSSTVTTKGQVLIPALIRSKLNIKPFDRVIFNVYGSKLLAEKAASTEDMFGIVKTKRVLTDRQLETAIKKATEESLSQQL
ncbi:MAG: hypothetical protein UX99_C0007G0042 [Candidatus Amesbacteria bacterium GW2011_GWB1_47_26]|uniref:SpoVT-AbrB domain-containing protein n=1 Tax=Candidatus Amesbacteria bacterium GW2011_GWC2_45_19 TaxID=1618366 RepID=A0A0G1PB83_9BACT|nr:MAG: hypothetical protein UX05_C0010G0020 [Candidatus Amesbacteria bacterium GW2011_GWC2_45_19]KKU38094.1 MAG: hypothetical protein UX52_C0011G0024 [Candidatus Amesbacteria bacterium GW2011_GWA1_46_35]KKU69067.1 MAG: hypothetical protein UX93_C0003G0059 [Microgenomates group bacterium GW2011_GWC1_47_20]KKU74754.1 MAG: hypothetical protein UX99_C0007G0042 [Candidatus Amesbacteria bacterium GW2011_GWB1_47_26]KKU80185.1 MAG: hypothetical protein UY06_C0004G0006 [Candidatus Amesbacteria bacteriu